MKIKQCANQKSQGHVRVRTDKHVFIDKKDTLALNIY